MHCTMYIITCKMYIITYTMCIVHNLQGRSAARMLIKMKSTDKDTNTRNIPKARHWDNGFEKMGSTFWFHNNY